ncbi:hypothetical protein BJ508DRAFT_31226 [Ascobolus immersus RN42]|uniref:Uncharacterized protein n=1 Tax=Ascobolus immersus RN42 TaxID=1160509 RepID=A0A3N4IFY0_ASCIM|nr:hypothetical protein BJ508DRAFT_31226 [Ascobolus immersus RN42]
MFSRSARGNENVAFAESSLGGRPQRESSRLETSSDVESYVSDSDEELDEPARESSHWATNRGGITRATARDIGPRRSRSGLTETSDSATVSSMTTTLQHTAPPRFGGSPDFEQPWVPDISTALPITESLVPPKRANSIPSNRPNAERRHPVMNSKGGLLPPQVDITPTARRLLAHVVHDFASSGPVRPLPMANTKPARVLKDKHTGSRFPVLEGQQNVHMPWMPLELEFLNKSYPEARPSTAHLQTRLPYTQPGFEFLSREEVTPKYRKLPHGGNKNYFLRSGEASEKFSMLHRVQDCEILKVLASAFRDDPRICQYLQKWQPYIDNQTSPVFFNEGILIYPDCWKTAVMSDTLRIASFWRGSIHVIIPSQDADYGKVKCCSPEDLESIEWLHDLLGKISSGEKRDEQYIFLAEDLSAWIISLLGTFLGILPVEFNEFSKSGGNAITSFVNPTHLTANNGRTFSLEGAIPIRASAQADFVRDLEHRAGQEAKEIGSMMAAHMHRPNDFVPRIRRKYWGSKTQPVSSSPESVDDQLCFGRWGRNILRPIASHLKTRDEMAGHQNGFEHHYLATEAKITVIRSHSGHYVCLTDPRLDADRCSSVKHGWSNHEKCLQSRLNGERRDVANSQIELKASYNPVDSSEEDAAFRVLSLEQGLNIDTGLSQRTKFATAFMQMFRKVQASKSRGKVEQVEFTMTGVKFLFSSLYLHLWKTTFEDITSFFDSTQLTASNDECVSAKLQDWRDCFGELEVFLSVSASRLHNLEKSMEQVSSQHTMLASELRKECGALSERLVRTSQTVHSTMAVLESKEAIKETHAVTRLTELAFIFIPMSFATSFFGMEVSEWQVSKPSLLYFGVLAIALLISTYSVRLILRSQRFANLKIEAKGWIIDSRSVDMPARERKPLSTFEVSRWMLNRMWEWMSSDFLYILRLPLRFFVRLLKELLGPFFSWRNMIAHCIRNTLYAVIVAASFLFTPLFPTLSMYDSLFIIEGVIVFFTLSPFLGIQFRTLYFTGTMRDQKHEEAVEFLKRVTELYQCMRYKAMRTQVITIVAVKGLLMSVVLWGIPCTVTWYLSERSSAWSDSRYKAISIMAGITLFAVSRLTLWDNYCISAVIFGTLFFTGFPSLLIWLGNIPYFRNWGYPLKAGVGAALSIPSVLLFLMIITVLALIQEACIVTFDPFQTQFFSPITSRRLKLYCIDPVRESTDDETDRLVVYLALNMKEPQSSTFLTLVRRTPFRALLGRFRKPGPHSQKHAAADGIPSARQHGSHRANGANPRNSSASGPAAPKRSSRNREFN